MRLLVLLPFCLNLLAPPAWANSCEADLFSTPDEFHLAEEAAFRSVEATLITGEQAEAEVMQWADSLKRRQNSGGTLSVMQYSALLHVIRSDFLHDLDNPGLKEELPRMLAKAWRDLSDQEPAAFPAILEKRLPYRVLRRASDEARVFHAAVFQSENAFGKNCLALGRDYLPKLRDFIAATGLAAVAFNETGRQILGAAVMGYLVGSLAEYTVHRYVSHPTARMKQWFLRAGWLGKGFYRTAYLHAVHHHQTFQTSYTRQFDSEEQKTKIETTVRKHGVVETIAEERRFGLLLDESSRLSLIAGTAPFAFIASWLMNFDLFSVQTLVTTLGALAYIPHLELTHIAEHAPQEKGAPILKWFSKTRYFAYVNRMHFVHHRDENSNYNGIPGVDVLFGQLRKPTVEDILRMRRAGDLL